MTIPLCEDLLIPKWTFTWKHGGTFAPGETITMYYFLKRLYLNNSPAIGHCTTLLFINDVCTRGGRDWLKGVLLGYRVPLLSSVRVSTSAQNEFLQPAVVRHSGPVRSLLLARQGKMREAQEACH